MPLVNYDSSGGESEEEDNPTEDTSQTNATKPIDSSSQDSTDKPKTWSLFSSLPAPKTMINNSSLLPNSSLNDIVVEKSKSGPIRISVPSLKHYLAEEEDDEELNKSKRIKPSNSGTGLSALLPKPKKTFSTTSQSLIPQSLLRPKATSTSTAKRTQSLAKNKVEEQTSEDTTNYFFNVDDNKVDDIIADKSVPLSDVEFGPKPHFAANVTSDSTQSSTTSTPAVNDMTYKKLIASKFGEEAPEDIDIIDIDVSKHLRDSKDWLKTITEEKEETYSGVQPTSTARRKHQITYLALQAKQREVELKNEWARNRTTKTQSRAKYGF